MVEVSSGGDSWAHGPLYAARFPVLRGIVNVHLLMFVMSKVSLDML